MLPTLNLFFLYYSPAQLVLLFLKHLYRNKSAAYKWICTDVLSTCKQHKAAEFLQEIKESGYMSKGVHWRQNSCSRVFWTFTYHFPIPKHGVTAAVFHSCQRLHSLPNCYQTFGVRFWACDCAVQLQLSVVKADAGRSILCWGLSLALMK